MFDPILKQIDDSDRIWDETQERHEAIDEKIRELVRLGGEYFPYSPFHVWEVLSEVAEAFSVNNGKKLMTDLAISLRTGNDAETGRLLREEIATYWIALATPRAEELLEKAKEDNEREYQNELYESRTIRGYN